MARLVVAASLALLILAPALPARANTVDCGGNSFSYAEVVPPKRGKARKGPLQVVPDSLCADLIETRPPQVESLQVTIDPHSEPRRPDFPARR